MPSDMTAPSTSLDLASYVSITPPKPLRYSIAACSSHSGSYVPQHILFDQPHDIASRWSGASATASLTPDGAPGDSAAAGGVGRGNKQWILLELERPAIVRTITFGKYHKPHPCNLKDFKVYGGPSPEQLVKLLRGGLRNDSVPDTFDLAHRSKEGVYLPVRYIKLVPLAAHLPNYNFSVWHVALSGLDDERMILEALRRYDLHREDLLLRMILKHLRSRRHFSAFRALQSSANLSLEHPLLTELYDALVLKGDFDRAEHILERAAGLHVLPQEPSASDLRRGVDSSLSRSPSPGAGPSGSPSPFALGAASPLSRDRSADHTDSPRRSSSVHENNRGRDGGDDLHRGGLFNDWMKRAMPKPFWEKIDAANADGDAPSGRGGHQMCFDTDKGIAYLFGGWDGSQDLGDFWAYNVCEGRWRTISYDTRLQGGPGPRSCHKMAFDPRTGFIYVFGKFINFDQPKPSASMSPTPYTTSVSSRSNLPSTSSIPRPGVGTGNSLAPPPPLSAAGSLPDQLINAELLVSPSSPVPASRTAGTGSRTPIGLPPAVAASGSSRQSPRRASRSERQFAAATTGEGDGMQGVESTATSSSASSSHRPSPSRAPASHSQNHHQHQQRHASPVGTISGCEADFWRYSTRLDRWERLSADTAEEGGPKLIFDHQMVIDPDTQHLYVFGGRVVHPDPSRSELSGMWRYDIISRIWTFLFDDSSPYQSRILSRIGHSMLLDQKYRQIWIFAGQRDDHYLSDLYTYSLTTGAVREMSPDYSLTGGPEGGFTQRATIDPVLREIYVLTGLTKSGKSEVVRSTFWIYRLDREEWVRVYDYGDCSASRERKGRLDHYGPAAWAATKDAGEEEQEREPQPRYAAQMVYNPKGDGTFYLFGGNPGALDAPNRRLNDFWSLKLQRSSPSEALRQCKFEVRRQRFMETTQSPNVNLLPALLYLQNDVSAVVNHEDEVESTSFRSLMTHLFTRGQAAPSATSVSSVPPTVRASQAVDLIGGGAGGIAMTGTAPSSDKVPRKAGTARVSGDKKRRRPKGSMEGSGSRGGGGDGTSGSSGLLDDGDTEMTDEREEAEVEEEEGKEDGSGSPRSLSRAALSPSNETGPTVNLHDEDGAPEGGEGTVAETSLKAKTSLEDDRFFAQRTEVFELLLDMFPPELTEPEGRLIDGVELDMGV